MSDSGQILRSVWERRALVLVNQIQVGGLADPDGVLARSLENAFLEGREYATRWPVAPPLTASTDYEVMRQSVRAEFDAVVAKNAELIAERNQLLEADPHPYYRDLINRLCQEITRLNKEVDSLTAGPVAPQEAAAKARVQESAAFINNERQLEALGEALRGPARPPQPQFGGFLCADCKAPINAGEAKCFNVCDACWQKTYPTADRVTAGPPASPPALEVESEALALLRRMRGWDHLEGSADGPYWRREIDRVLAVTPEAPKGDQS